MSCILEVDFLSKFGIVLNFGSASWSFARDEKKHYVFESVDVADKVCSGISELTPSEEDRLNKFLNKNLPATVDNPGMTNLTEHWIDVNNHPIKQRCYLVSPKVQEAIRDEIDKMLQAEIIEPSISEWSNSIVMVKKPNGKYRFCLDFRKVNSVSKKDPYSLPKQRYFR